MFDYIPFPLFTHTSNCVPTCFGSQRIHQQGALYSAWLQITRLILSCPLTWTRSVLWQHILNVIRYNKYNSKFSNIKLDVNVNINVVTWFNHRRYGRHSLDQGWPICGPRSMRGPLSPEYFREHNLTNTVQQVYRTQYGKKTALFRVVTQRVVVIS